MSKPFYIYRISTNYTRCEIWAGHRTFHYRMGSTVFVPDKGLTRRQRYEAIVAELVNRFGLVGPSYQTTSDRKWQRQAIQRAMQRA